MYLKILDMCPNPHPLVYIGYFKISLTSFHVYRANNLVSSTDSDVSEDSHLVLIAHLHEPKIDFQVVQNHFDSRNPISSSQKSISMCLKLIYIWLNLVFVSKVRFQVSRFHHQRSKVHIKLMSISVYHIYLSYYLKETQLSNFNLT